MEFDIILMVSKISYFFCLFYISFLLSFFIMNNRRMVYDPYYDLLVTFFRYYIRLTTPLTPRVSISTSIMYCYNPKLDQTHFRFR